MVRRSNKRSYSSKKRNKSRRRRLSRKRVKRNKTPRLTKQSILNLLSPKREWIRDYRGRELASLQDRVHYEVISVGGCISCYKGVLADVGAGSEALGDNTDKQTQYKFTNYILRTHFRNVSNHDCFMEIFACVSRRDSYLDTADNSLTSTDDRAMHKLIDGWDYKTAAARINRAGGGTEVVYTDGNTYCESYSNFLSPFMSKAFTQSYKVENVWRVKLAPGDDFFVKQRIPSFVYDSMKHDEGFGDTTSQTQQEDVGGITKFLLVKTRGVLGKGNLDDTKTGFVTTDIAYEHLVKLKVQKMNRDKDLLALEATGKDDLTGVTLEGPTEHEMQDQDL